MHLFRYGLIFDVTALSPACKHRNFAYPEQVDSLPSRGLQ